MIRILLLMLIVYVILFAVVPMSFAKDYALTIEVIDARGDDGAVIVCLWSEANAESFPRCSSEDAVRSDPLRITDGRAVVVFNGLQAGSYAVTALHDENGDGRMNRAFMRPDEGLAISVLERISMPPPDFGDAAFELTSDRSITLNLQYW